MTYEFILTDRTDDAVTVPSEFDVFFAGSYSSIVGVAYGLTGSRWVAEDLAQEAFVRALSRWDAVRKMEFRELWVRRVLINLANSRWRRVTREARALLMLRNSSADDTLLGPTHDAFWSEVRRLPPRQAQAIALRYVLELSTAEIAQTMELAEGTVRALLHQGRERLRRQLSAKGIVE